MTEWERQDTGPEDRCGVAVRSAVSEATMFARPTAERSERAWRPVQLYTGRRWTAGYRVASSTLRVRAQLTLSGSGSRDGANARRMTLRRGPNTPSTPSSERLHNTSVTGSRRLAPPMKDSDWLFATRRRGIAGRGRRISLGYWNGVYFQSDVGISECLFVLLLT